MSDHILKTIDDVERELAKDEAEVRRKKQLINMLCDQAGVEPRYSEAELDPETKKASLAFSGDEFYGEALNSAIKKYLKLREAAGVERVATADDIHSALSAGGYSEFDSDENTALNSLKITLGKSSHTFIKLPNGKYGLKDWYDDVKPKKKTKRRGKKAAEGDDGEDRGDGSGGSDTDND